MEAFETYKDVRPSITTPDGNIYAIPEVIKLSIAQVNAIWVNGHWTEALGITEMPETVDELYDMLVRFRDEGHNGNGVQDEIPLGSSMNVDPRNYMLAAFGLLGNDVEVVDDVVRFNPATENYKAYLTYMKKLFDEKLIDPNMFSQSYEQELAKGKEGTTGLGAVAVPALIFDAGLTIHKMLPPIISEYTSENWP